MADNNPIYKFMKDNGLTQKDEATFVKEYSDPAKTKELYQFMVDNKLTEKSLDQFSSEYFPKPTEVSVPGSTPTSPISPEPTQSIQQQNANQTVTDVSQIPPLGDASHQSLGGGVTVQPGFKVGEINGMQFQYDPNNPVGEAYNPLPEVRATTPQERAAENLTFWSNIKNASSNAWERMKTWDDRLKLLSADAAESILGKDLAKAYYANEWLALGEGARDINQVRAEALAELGRSENAILPTAQFVDSFNRNDIGGVANAVIASTINMAQSALLSVTPEGVGMAVDMLGDGLYQYNKKKAEANGVSIEDLYKQGKSEFWTPMLINSIAVASERIGYKGMQNAMVKNLTGPVMKKLGVLGYELNKEGMTEWFQTGLSFYQDALAAGGSQSDAANAMWNGMFSDEGLESYLQGVAGSAALGGAGRLANKMVSKNLKKSVSEKENRLNKIKADIVATLDQNVKSTLLDEAANIAESINNDLDKDLDVVNKLPDTVKAEVEDLNTNILSSQMAIEDPNISDETKEVLRNRIQEDQKAIDDLVKNNSTENVVVTQTEKPADTVTTVRTPEQIQGDITAVTDRMTELVSYMDQKDYTKAFNKKQRASIEAEYTQLAQQYGRLLKESEGISDKKEIKMPELTPEILDKLSQTPIQNDTKNETGVSSEVGVGQESVQAEPQQTSRAEEAAPSGNVQTSQTQEVNENIEIPSETVVENSQVVPVGEQVQGQGEAVAKTSSGKYYQGIPKSTPYMQGLIDEKGNVLIQGSIEEVEAFKKKNGINNENVSYVDLDTNNPDSLINKFLNKNKGSSPKIEDTKALSTITEQTPTQEEIVAPTQVNEPVSDKVNPKLKEVIKSVPNQDLNTLMGPANVEARRDVIETVTGKRPSKNDSGIARVKQVVADYLGVTGNDSQKVQAIKNWANFERTEFSSPEEATRYMAENTTDPQEILRMYDEQPQLDQSDKGIAIAQWLGDKGKINLSDFTRWGDRNNLTRDISSRRIDTGDNLMGLDAQLEADGLAAQGITPEDVVNFVTNYKDEADYRQVNRSETEKLLEDRYKALTGRNITPKALDRLRQQSATERANLAAEQEANQSLAEAGVTQEELAAQQQMEAEQGREPRQESTGKTPKSLLKGIADRLSETGLAKSVKITDTQGVSDILGRMNNVNFQLGDAISKFMNLGLFSKGDFTRSISGNIIGLKKSVAAEIEVERLGIKELAQKNGTWLKSPNGKATNLHPDEWVTVRTKRFKEWFGDWENNPRRSSKIVDENGEPAIYYNGSKTSFNEYDKKYFYTGEGAMHYGAGFYFTPRPETAKSYSRQSVLIDYVNKVRSVMDSLDVSRLDTFLDTMPAYVGNNMAAIDKSLENFNKYFDELLNKTKDRLDKTKDIQEKSALQDIYHNLSMGKPFINSLIDIKKRNGLPEGNEFRNDIKEAIKTITYWATTKNGVSNQIGVGDGVVASLFLNVRNPLNWEGPANIGLINKVNEELRKRGLKPIGSIHNNNGSVYAAVAVSLNEPMVKGTNFRQYTQTSEFFESIGIDGVLHTTQTQWTRGAYFNQAAGEVQVIAFEPNQIKSTANVGTFESGMNDMRFQQNQDVINGFVDADGNIVINSDNAGIDTPIHEFGHIWERTMETANPELHARGMELIRGEDGQPYVDYVRQTQPGLQGDAIYKEALAQVIGDNGARLIETQKRSVIKEWLKAAWDFIASLRGLSGMTPSEIANLTLREYAEGAAVDLLQGKPINKTPMGNMVMETQATTEKEMTPAEKFNADFIRRRQQAMSTYFSGEISDLLSDSDFRDYVEFTKNAIDMGQIPGKAEHDTLAAQLGITNAGQIDLAYKLATLRAKQATGIQTGQVSKDALEMANFESMSDTELRDAGRQLVDQGLVDPVSMVRDIISKPRPISAQEVAALQYYQSTLNGEYATVSDLLDSRDQAAIDAYSFQGETGFKGLSIKADALRQASYDLDLAIIASGKEQSAAFRLRSVLSDKDFNIVSFLADMKSRGYITKDQEAKFNAMAKELSDIKAKLKQADDRAEKRKTKIAEGNMEEVAKRNPRAPRRNRPEVVEAFTDVLGGLNPDDFGITGMNFQKGLVQFSMQPNTALGQAVSDAIGRMQQNVKSGTMNVGEAIETAISEINNTVGEGNWDVIKFRSTIMNRMTNKSQVIKAAKPYVNSNGTLIIPGAYLTDLVKQGHDTIDAMVDQANTELGGQFSEYDIRNAISGYGRQAAPKLNEIERKKNVARTIARMLSELEDLNTKGERAKTEKVKHEIDNRVRALKDEIKQREYDLEMTPEERAQLAEQRYSDTRKKYLENYIKQLQERIDNGDFAPQKHVNKYEDSPEVTELKAQAERVKNEFKKAKYEHELATMSIEQKTAKFIYEFIFNSTRALAAGSDLSAIGVQGAIFAAARPADAAKLLWGSRKQTFSQKEYEDYFAHMQTDPYFEMARKAGLNLQLPGFYQSVQEEQFKGDVGSIIENYAFKPVARGIAKVTGGTRQGADKFVESYSPLSAADRNYAVVLSSIRLDLFKEFMNNQMTKVGLNAEIDAEKVKQLAETVNTITMAATVPFTKGNKAANAITSALFFSLRKMIATWKILGMWAPMTYNSIRGDAMNKAFNRQLLRDTYGGIILNGLGRMLALGSIPFIAGAVYGFGGDDDDPEKDSALEAGARYMYNPNFYNAKHSDFLKIRLGDTRISLFQGIDGNIVLGTRLASQEYMTSSSNAVKELNGVGGNKTMRQLGIDYLANKLAPTAALVWQYTGTERERGEIGDRFTGSIFPMWMSSAYEQFEATDKPYEAIALGALGVIGLSYNNYGGAEFATREGTNNAQARKIFKDSGLSAFNPSSGTRTYFDGEKVQKAKDPFLGGKGYFSKEYLPAYEEFMNEAVLSNKDKLAVNVDWSIKEGLVNNLKREAYKYAEIKTTGVAMGANFKNFSVDGEDYTLLPSQYKLKAKYIKLLMEDNATPKYLAELAKEIRDSDPKITPKRAQMLALIAAYNEANSEAKFNLMDDYESGKIKLIKKTDYTKDMEKEDLDSEE